jgi:tRNA pseudouridine32 synthase / 23S rRNA pseudouridine746 synthase
LADRNAGAVADVPVTFLYDDAALVVVDKPAGVAVIPMPDAPPGSCLRDRVAAALGTRVWVVHRLDRDTSGVVVFARTAEAHRALSMAFERRDVVKRYTALVHGVPAPTAGTIELPLHEARKGKARPARPDEPGARPATTDYAVTRAWTHDGQRVAAVAATPRTGRHHQIRVHLRAVGTPILGDAVYGRASAARLPGVPVPRLALHAASIDVPHPAGERRVTATAPWPAELAALTTWLDTQWAVEVAP